VSVVLVTGGAGYVGSHAAYELALAGHDVVLFDDLSAGHVEAADRLTRAFPAGRVSFVRGDIGDAIAVGRALRESTATAVLHFAARALVAESVAQPLAYYRTNLTGTLTLLSAMVDAGVDRFVFSSTCATFGEPVQMPIDETHPQRPVNAYGETKLAVERALPHLERATGLRSVALRYFNAAGAHPSGLIGEDHAPEAHLIPRAVAAAMGRGPLAVFGTDYPTPDGTCIRDYVHVTDLAAAHLRALARLEAGGASGAYNLGSGQGASVRQVIDCVARVTGREVPFTFEPRRAGDPAVLVAASDLARRELGWTPKFDSLDGIVSTAWAWHERHPFGYRTPGTA
jgi:UDP-glucose-4-epimerase GalE